MVDAPQRNEADLIATASREYAACTLLSNNSLVQAQFETQRFGDGATLSITDTEITQGKSVSQAMSERRAPEVYKRAPADLVVPSSSVITEYGATGAIQYTRAFLPQDAIVFDDGRIGIPTTFLVTNDESWGNAQAITAQSTSLSVWVHIGSIWKLDEVIPLCFGDCDAYWQDLTLSNATPASTPVPIATPAALDFDHRRA